MAWVNRTTHWHWLEDRKKDSKGHFIGDIPQQPSVKRLDYATINSGTAGHEHKLAIGVWDDETYTPINRLDLEFFTRQYTFDAEIKGAVLVNQPIGKAVYHSNAQTWEWKQ